MSEDTKATSQAWADATFDDPELCTRFEVMARETGKRKPVRDDFSWLSPEAASVEHSRFEDLTRRLLSVPRSAIDVVRRKGH